MLFRYLEKNSVKVLFFYCNDYHKMLQYITAQLLERSLNYDSRKIHFT